METKPAATAKKGKLNFLNNERGLAHNKEISPFTEIREKEQNLCYSVLKSIGKRPPHNSRILPHTYYPSHFPLRSGVGFRGAGGISFGHQGGLLCRDSKAALAAG